MLRPSVGRHTEALGQKVVAVFFVGPEYRQAGDRQHIGKDVAQITHRHHLPNNWGQGREGGGCHCYDCNQRVSDAPMLEAAKDQIAKTAELPPDRRLRVVDVWNESCHRTDAQ